MDLELLWFCLIAVLWSGYLALEGFDFGVGMLLPVVGRNDAERSAMLRTIGPVWDANEVWLVVAAGATFAAFPAWYATMFSAFYVPLTVVLVLLIVRAVSFEWHGKGESARWRAVWAWANTIGSVGIPFVWGVALANLLGGIPLDAEGSFTGGLGDLVSPYTLLTGVAFVLLCALHGAVFLELRTTGELQGRAVRAVRAVAVPAAAVVVAFLVATVVVAVERNDRGAIVPLLPALVGIAAVAVATALVFAGRVGAAFTATAAATVAVVATLFAGLYPRVVVSHPTSENSLTVDGAASSHYALQVISVVALACVPAVLVYQAWTYHVFRRRVSGDPPGDGAAPPPVSR